MLYCIGNCFMVLSIPFLFFGFRRTIANHLEVPFVLKLSFIDHILFLSVMGTVGDELNSRSDAAGLLPPAEVSHRARSSPLFPVRNEHLLQEGNHHASASL